MSYRPTRFTRSLLLYVAKHGFVRLLSLIFQVMCYNSGKDPSIELINVHISHLSLNLSEKTRYLSRSLEQESQSRLSSCIYDWPLCTTAIGAGHEEWGKKCAFTLS